MRNIHTRPDLRRSGKRLRWAPLLAIGVGVGLAGCDVDRLLDAEDPTVAAPGTLATEQAVPTTLSAALGAFAIGFSGAPGGGSFIDGQISLSGTLGDEVLVSESFPTRIDVDRRETVFDNSTQLATFARLQTARRLAEFSAELHNEFDGTRNTEGHAHALNLAAYSYVLFGENYCSGVPFSNISSAGAIENAPPLSTTEIFTRADALFDEALAIATTVASEDQQQLARVGKARSLLNLNRPGDAVEAIGGAVPTSFAYEILHSSASGRQQNGVWGGNTNGRRFSPSDSEGGNGLPYRSDNDPRVRTEAGTGPRANGFDPSTPFFDVLKYPTNATSVVLASGLEARLIEAEAQLRTGGDWLGTLNALRADPPAYYMASLYPNLGDLDPLANPGSEAAAIDLLFKERAYWMWLTSHRLGDLRRLLRQYGRTEAEAGFPTGSYFRGADYGNHVSVLVPFDELNNELFAAEFPNGCDPTAAGEVTQ